MANPGSSLTTSDRSGAAATAMVFVRDHDSEGVIRQALSDLRAADVQFTTGTVTTAIGMLRVNRSPRLLIVELDANADPAAQVEHLSEVCEPGTGVIVIGKVNDIRLYRSLLDTGIVEYYFMPLVGSLLTRVCNGVLTGDNQQRTSHTGKLTIVLGARPGAGATTIAAATAWLLAEVHQRRVGVLDLDLQFGDAALLLDAAPSHALREALDHPERVDELFLERGIASVTSRLSILASLEPLDDDTGSFKEEAVLSLLDHLLRRYRYVIVDMPTMHATRMPRVLHLPGTCLLVSTASLASARDVARWREKIGPNGPERSTLHVLNKSGSEGSLPEEQFIRAAGQAPDIILPFSRDISAATDMGTHGIAECRALRRGLAPLLQNLSGEALPVERPSFLSRLWR
jgi:pilus assembly protein CpaE